jgi:nucleoside triphosphate pyrophosphatase
MSALALQPIVLASASEIRAALLRRAGLELACAPAGVDESEIKESFRREGFDAGQCAAALAEAKARRISARQPDRLVVGADQMLVCAEGWLDKPADLAAAREQLLRLRGKRHELVTAACVVRNGAVLWQTVARSFLYMRPFSDAFLEAYLQALGDKALDSVGAYQLEGLGAQLFARIEGDYFAILGLPLLPLLDFLRGQGVVAA